MKTFIVTYLKLVLGTATQLNLAINEHKRFVQIIADAVDKGYLKTADQIFDSYRDDLSTYHFCRLVIVDKNGNGITSDGYTIENYENINEFFTHNDVYLSEDRPSVVSDAQVNIYSKVIHLDGESKVLCATIYTEDYKNILVSKLFDGQGGTYLINNNGDVLIDSFDIIKENKVNLYNFIQANYSLTSSGISKITDMSTNIKNNISGTFDINLNKNTYFINYTPVDVNNWYVVSIAPDDIIAEELIFFLRISFGVCLFINLIILAICIYIDISNQRETKKVYKVAYIDPVTAFGNELYFKEYSTALLKNSANNRYIISIDISKFNILNNLYGYEFCNHLLRTFAKNLKTTLPANNITCRMYSDVFVSIFSYSDSIKTLMKNVINTISNITVDDTNLHLNLSVGIYKIKLSDKDINKLIDKSYIARAKIKGKSHNNFYIFDEELENKLIEEHKIETAMEQALKDNEFKVVYQPKFFTDTEKLAGAEALVRWNKNGTFIPPNQFIPLFEKNKFILKLDIYIFEQVCKDMANWKKEYGFTPTISINVSKEHFVNKNFVNKYAQIADKYGIEHDKIDLEITESATVDKDIDILDILNNIKQQGFTISIDDFGTGYSSLSMLQNMPIDIIKIDKVFVDKADLQSNKNIINYITLIAKRLGCKTIVEGVEHLEQVEFVKKIKCDIIQGYYYSKPIPKDEFEKFF